MQTAILATQERSLGEITKARAAIATLPDPRHPAHGLLNIETELAYWKGIISRTEFSQVSLRFSHFVPTIKFSYDCYLLFHHAPLCNLLPDLRERYERIMLPNECLEWRWADQIVRHTWGRMAGEQQDAAPRTLASGADS